MSIVWSYTSPCSVNWNGRACGPRHCVKTIWPSHDWKIMQLICSESVVIRTLVERQREYIVVYYNSSLLEYRFTVWSIKPVTNTSLVHDLNVEIGTTTESRVYRTLSWWRERFDWWRRVEFDWWHVETATSSQPVLLPGELGSTVASFRRSKGTICLQSRLLSWQTTDLPEGQVIEAYLLLLCVFFCNSLGNFDF